MRSWRPSSGSRAGRRGRGPPSRGPPRRWPADEDPRVARARRLDLRIRPGRPRVPDPDAAPPWPGRARPGGDLPLARERGGGDARAGRGRRGGRGRAAAAGGAARPGRVVARRPPPRAGGASGLSRARRAAGTHCRDAPCRRRPRRPGAGARHPLQRAVLGLRLDAHPGDRARRGGPGRALLGRAAACGGGGQRAGQAWPGHRHRPAGAARRRDAARPVRHGHRGREPSRGGPRARGPAARRAAAR